MSLPKKLNAEKPKATQGLKLINNGRIRFIIRYENREKKSEGNYNNGDKIGAWVYWNEGGIKEIINH